jgi:uracil-DNA glycosylase family 4
MTLQAADLSRPQLEALLRWYVEAGVDCPIDEAPHDRFAEFAEAQARAQAAQSAAQSTAQSTDLAPARSSAPLRAQGAPPAALRPLPPVALNAGEAAEAARRAAQAADTLEALRAALDSFEGCAFRRTATQLVFGEGPVDARVMCIGEAPGAEDDREGRPFSGAGGRLLDRMFAAVGLSRETMRLAHVSPWRTPGNRKLTPQEASACLPFARRHIELVAPDVLVCFGEGAAQTLLDVREGVLRARGKTHEFALGGAQGRMVPALIMLNPEFLLRQPLYKRQTFADLRALRRMVDALPPRG